MTPVYVCVCVYVGGGGGGVWVYVNQCAISTFIGLLSKGTTYTATVEYNE